MMRNGKILARPMLTTDRQTKRFTPGTAFENSRRRMPQSKTLTNPASATRVVWHRTLPSHQHHPSRRSYITSRRSFHRLVVFGFSFMLSSTIIPAAAFTSRPEQTMEGPVTALAMVLGSGLPFSRRSKQVTPAESLSTESLPAITNKPTGSIGTQGKKTPGKTFGSMPTVRNSLARPGAFASRVYNAEGHVTYRFIESRERRRQLILNNNKFALWRERLLRVSRIGSILCVIDCTLLPIVTFLLPLLGVVNPHLEWLHDLGHSMALYFVLPGE